jgi:hypothetical protein
MRDTTGVSDFSCGVGVPPLAGDTTAATAAGAAIGAAATEDGADGADDADANSTGAEGTGALADDTGEIRGVAGGDDDDGDGSMTCAIAKAPNRHAIPATASRLRML